MSLDDIYNRMTFTNFSPEEREEIKTAKGEASFRRSYPHRSLRRPDVHKRVNYSFTGMDCGASFATIRGLSTA